MQIRDIVLKKFLEKALPQLRMEFKPETVIVFGSRVTGQQRESSDIDMIIVSDYFRQVSFVNRMGLVLKKLRPKRHLDAICYTPQEFQQVKQHSSVINNALKEGLVIDKGEF